VGTRVSHICFNQLFAFKQMKACVLVHVRVCVCLMSVFMSITMSVHPKKGRPKKKISEDLGKFF
jgi:hypothetical protein